jgi:HEAT repeat protein
MTHDTQIQTLIDHLCVDYSSDVARKLVAHGETALEPLIAALHRVNVDANGQITLAEVAVNILLAAQNGHTDEVLARLRQHPNSEVRRCAIGALRHVGSKEAIQMLRDALADEDETVQHAAAYALISLLYGGDDVQAFQAALSDPHPHVRYIAVKSLEFMGATLPMMEAIENNEPSVRRISVYYMGRNRVSEAVDRLIVALRDDDLEVRRGAIWALGELGNSRAISEIRQLASMGDDRVVRTVREALQKLGYRPR